MTYLYSILEHIGFEPRPQQTKLFEVLVDTDDTGTVAQAGTGTGKSLAVLAAAAYWRHITGRPSLVVVPMNNLLTQYIKTDAPRVEEALGIRIRGLMGRNRYLCEAASGFQGVPGAPDWVLEREVELSEALVDEDAEHTLSPKDASWFGCPGRDEGCEPDTHCWYRRAKADLEGADIIITNAHLLVLDDQLKSQPPLKRECVCDGVGCELCITGEMVWQPRIFPDFGALFVDECHTLEDVLRGFATRAINLSVADAMGVELASWLRAANGRAQSPYAVDPDGQLVGHLRELATYGPPEGEKLKKREKDAVKAADFILRRGKDGAYAEHEAVLWVDVDHSRGMRSNPRLVSTQINLAGGAARILTKQPFGLVSGTVPKSLRGALGITDARFVNVGHPFDYARQGKLKVSKLSGSFKATKDPNNRERRAEEVLEAIAMAKGGTLVLFSSYRDMEDVWMQIRRPLEGAHNLDVRMQDRECDKAELGRWFKEHGNAVLFGTESFATGFDAPGDALRQVIIWKLPYGSLDPVTRAIMARSRQRYEDAMKMKLAQAVGRLIRTTTDTGTIFVVDSRMEDVIGDDDPMLAHLEEFQRIDQPKRRRAWDID